MKLQKQLWIKFGTIVGVLLLLQLPAMVIQELVSERAATRDKVIQDISQSWGQAQRVTGPFLVVPWEQIKQEKYWDENLKKYLTRDKAILRESIITPENTMINAKVSVSQRHRGIYNAPVYTGLNSIEGYFNLDQLKDIPGKIKQVRLVILSSDLSGIVEIPELKIGSERVSFTEGGYRGNSGISALINQDSQPFSFRLNSDIKGSQEIYWYPVAKNNSVSVQSDWPHPSFNGKFLPENYEISENGFSANWRTTSLSSNVGQLFKDCKPSNCYQLTRAGFGVSFVEPVNDYSMSSRAAKYSVLFILITFSIFFLLETIKSGSVHPVQYLLVGTALTIFNLVLIALSEHIDFQTSYIVSACSCLVLILFYVRKILETWFRSLGFISVLTLVYGILFFILKSEDYAFLMGAGLIFVILSAVMLVTRNVDWYAINYRSSRSKAESAL